MSVRPSHALTHPWWLGALGMLLLNDHLLKGAGLLPTVLTGKLSDVAGLMVAPVLLGALVAARSKTALAACHLAVGAVFAALQLSPAVAAAWDGGLGALGIPFHTVSDPTDLVALLALGVSWMVLVPATQVAEESPAGVRWVLGGAGLLSCIATSPIPEFNEEFWAQVWMHNDTNQELRVLIRPLVEGTQIDCGALAEAGPGQVLEERMFGPGQLWELPAGSAASVLEDPWDVQDCHVRLIEHEGAEPHVLFWSGGEPDVVASMPEELGPLGVSLSSMEDGGSGVVFAMQAGDGECVAQSPLDRVDWSISRNGFYTLNQVTTGPDGCLELGLTGNGGDERGYLCMPEALFPFADGDSLLVEQLGSSQAPRWERVTLTGEGGTVLALARSEGLLTVLNTGFVAQADDESCGWRTEATCGHVTRDAVVVADVGGEMAALGAGEGAVFEAPDAVTQVEVLRAEQRALSVPECGRWSDSTAFDLDVLVVVEPVAMGENQ